MNTFYSGFEKQASFRENLTSFGQRKYKAIGDSIAKLSLSAWGKKNVHEAIQDAADIASNTMKKDIVPQLDAFVNRTMDKPLKIEPTLEKLKTFKGGILPALAVGAALEGGRQGVKGLKHLPGYIKSRQNQDQSKKK